MAVNTNVTIAGAKAALNAVVDQFDGTASTSWLDIYWGTQPASPDAAVTAGNRVAHISLTNATTFGAAGTSGNSATSTASGVLPASDASATGASTAATFFRALKGATAIIDGSVGTGTAFDLVLNNDSIAAGQSVTISSWKVKLPKISS